MGHVYVDVTVIGSKGTVKTEALVDTGATWSVLPRRLADEVGAMYTGSMLKALTANGEVMLEVALVTLEIMGEKIEDTVLVSDMLNTVLIGVRTLEGLGYRVNPVTGRLEKIGVLLLSLLPEQLH